MKESEDHYLVIFDNSTIKYLLKITLIICDFRDFQNDWIIAE